MIQEYPDTAAAREAIGRLEDLGEPVVAEER